MGSELAMDEAVNMIENKNVAISRMALDLQKLEKTIPAFMQSPSLNENPQEDEKPA